MRTLRPAPFRGRVRPRAGATIGDSIFPRLRALSILLTALALLSLLPSARAAEPDFRLEGFPSGALGARQDDCRRAYAKARDWFGIDLDSAVTVRWATDPMQLRRHGVRNPESVAGLAIADSNLVILSAAALAPHPERLRPVLAHEICHLFVGAATARAELLPPRWLNEGIAMSVSGEWDLGLAWMSNHDSLLRDAMAADGVMPFRALEVGFPVGPFFQLAYAQSLSFVEWIGARQGEDGIRRLLQLLDDDLDPEPAFLKIYGMSLSAAELEWQKSIRRPGWARWIPSAGTVISFVWITVGLLMAAKFVRTRIQMRNTPDDEEELPPSEVR